MKDECRTRSAGRKRRAIAPGGSRGIVAGRTAIIVRLLALLSALVAAGCGERIETVYGQRNGPGASASVNGTAVLGEMFEQAGHKVYSWHVLSPRLKQRADCIVWFPDDFEPPSDAVRRWLEDWLYDQPDRTLLYVGRDFDAAAWYWEKIQPDAPAEQRSEVDRRLGEAVSDFSRQRRSIPNGKNCKWFTVDGTCRPRKVRTLSGDPVWLEAVDPSKLEIELHGRITPSPLAEVLLESDGDVLVSREEYDESRLIVVANGSFLLNLPLVNHEHRKVAGKLIDAVGRPGQTVVFLESGPGGPPVRPEDPDPRPPTGLEILLMYPFNWIFVHLAIVGILLCFARWPIFGIPRELETESTSDFGKHIQALGELLERSRDRAYAMTRLVHYQQTVKEMTKPE